MLYQSVIASLRFTGTFRSAIKDLGKLDCFTQDQYDFLKSIAMSAGESQIPSAAELDDMGTIAGLYFAAMSVETVLYMLAFIQLD